MEEMVIYKEYFKSLRDLVEFANEQKLTKDNIIQIVTAVGELGYYLIYQDTRENG